MRYEIEDSERWARRKRRMYCDERATRTGTGGGGWGEEASQGRREAGGPKDAGRGPTETKNGQTRALCIETSEGRKWKEGKRTMGRIHVAARTTP